MKLPRLSGAVLVLAMPSALAVGMTASIPLPAQTDGMVMSATETGDQRTQNIGSGCNFMVGYAKMSCCEDFGSGVEDVYFEKNCAHLPPGTSRGDCADQAWLAGNQATNECKGSGPRGELLQVIAMLIVMMR